MTNLYSLMEAFFITAFYFLFALSFVLLLELAFRTLFRGSFKNETSAEKKLSTVSNYYEGIKNLDTAQLYRFKNDIEARRITGINEQEYFILLNELEFRKNIR